jgi:hypothetical protein
MFKIKILVHVFVKLNHKIMQLFIGTSFQVKKKFDLLRIFFNVNYVQNFKGAIPSSVFNSGKKFGSRDKNFLNLNNIENGAYEIDFWKKKLTRENRQRNL